MAVYIKTAKKTYEFPDYSEQCPLCGRKNCAVRIGFYIRKILVSNFKTYYDVPIPRWLCRKKGHLKPNHRTFSLLPYHLIPYHRHDLNLALDTVNFKSQLGTTFEQTKSYISDKGIGTVICLENDQIIDFQQIFTTAFSKLMTIPELKQLIVSGTDFDSNDPITTVISFIESYQSPCLSTEKLKASNVEKLSWDFFFNFQTGCYFDRQFLFGTPSQKQQ